MALGLTAFLVGAIYWPGIVGAAVTTKWAVLSIALPLLVPRRVHVTPAHVLLALYVAWMLITMAWSPRWEHSVPAAWTLVLAALAFVIGAETRDLAPVYKGFALGLALSSAAVMAQLFWGWEGVTQMSQPAGLYMNRNSLTQISVMVVIGLTLKRCWRWLPLVVPATFLPMAKGSLLALAGALALASRRALVIGLVAAGIAGAAATDYRALLASDSVTERLAIWGDTIDGLTLTGRGIGSFYLVYPAHATRTNTFKQRPDNAHNDALEALYEGGVPALALLAALIVTLLRAPSCAEKYVFIAFCLIASISFPLHMPSTAFLGALAAGRLAARRAELCRSRPVRGVAVRGGDPGQVHQPDGPGIPGRAASAHHSRGPRARLHVERGQARIRDSAA